ncbi:hypothetical protein SCG7086_AB_00030 [Chlamydiales bacterium SCGC AG-110-P3]|nr:hypothetical protein SCG7086_AB_00030 [Chlamydiales bacterium SCGC AG-110-P3]
MLVLYSDVSSRVHTFDIKILTESSHLPTLRFMDIWLPVSQFLLSLLKLERLHIDEFK